MFLLLGYDHINNKDFPVRFVCFFLPSELRYYVKHRSYSINTHGPEDIVAVELGIGDNTDLNSKGAPRRQFSEKERCKET